MKYNIRINQRAIINSGLDNVTDVKGWIIFDYIYDWIDKNNSSTKRITIKNEQGVEEQYVWINYSHLLSELPLLGLKSKKPITIRIKQLEQRGLLKVFQAKDNTLYFNLTEKGYLAKYSPVVLLNERGVSREKQGVSLGKQHNNNISNNISSIILSSGKSIKKKSISKREEKTTTIERGSEVKALFAFFSEKCAEKRNINPEISHAKEGKLLKTRLKRFSTQDLKELIVWFLGSKEATELGCSLSICLCGHVINKWLERRTKTAWMFR